MLVVDHLTKMRMFTKAMGECEWGFWAPVGVWAAMHAATQAANVLLHHFDLTRAEPAFPTMSLRTYVVVTEGGMETVERSDLGDIIHADWLSEQMRTDERVAAIVGQLQIVEAAAFAFARGEAADEALYDEAYEAARELCSAASRR